jgi:hypothetical protein
VGSKKDTGYLYKPSESCSVVKKGPGDLYKQDPFQNN